MEAIATTELCDADASGAETAKWQIRTPQGGTLKMCDHHTFLHAPAMDAIGGFSWLDLTMVNAMLPEDPDVMLAPERPAVPELN